MKHQIGFSKFYEFLKGKNISLQDLLNYEIGIFKSFITFVLYQVLFIFLNTLCGICLGPCFVYIGILFYLNNIR